MAKKQKGKEKEILIGLTVTKEENFSEWYRQVIIKSDMIDYSDISGCYVIRPNAYNIWEQIQKLVNKEIKKMGVKNAYFPLFGTKANLEKETSHVNGFTPEVAWVTRAGSSNLDEPIHIRATSESIMYPHFSEWIKSHRDLPLKINQWCSVVRWEMKHCMPFIRSREFIWQESHSCFLTKEEADNEALQALELYADTYEKLLAVPVIRGRKSEIEKFAGADYTSTVECFIPVVGKAIQGATVHCLGQHFSKAYNIQVEHNGFKEFVYQNSWGLTTRSIGVMTMVHSDDKGLVLPPMVAPIQIIIIPCGITNKTSPENREKIYEKCKQIKDCLQSVDKQFFGYKVRIEIDDRNNYTPGYKFNYWEMRGCPIRFEIGPKDLVNNSVMIYRRDNEEKWIHTNLDIDVPDSTFLKIIKGLLENIQNTLYQRALTQMMHSLVFCQNLVEFKEAIQLKKMCLVSWCENSKCEDEIVSYCKQFDLSVKSLCIPFDQDLPNKITHDKNLNKDISNDVNKCFHCEEKAKSYALFGTSY